MNKLFSKIWGIVIPPLNTGDTFKITKDVYSESIMGYDKSYSVFGLINTEGKNNITRVHNCREVVGGWIDDSISNNNHKSIKDDHFSVLIAFKGHEINIPKIMEFFNYINSCMGEGKEIKVYLSNLKDVLVIDAAPWWFKSFYRHAMLSLLIRMGCVHYKGIFNDSMDYYALASRVKPVITMFLKGYVNEKSAAVCRTIGLVQIYKDMSETVLKSRLSKEIEEKI